MVWGSPHEQLGDTLLQAGLRGSVSTKTMNNEEDKSLADGWWDPPILPLWQ